MKKYRNFFNCSALANHHMNKKSLIKLGVAGIMLLLSLTLFFLLLMPFISNASQLREKYSIGEDIKINLEEYNNYTLKIITPANTFLKTGNEKSILFKPEEIGNYSVIIISENKSDSFMFEVVENNNSIEAENPIIGKPYKWKQIILVPENSKKIRIKVPKTGKNIAVYKNNQKLNFKADDLILNRIREIFKDNPDKEITLENVEGNIKLEYTTEGPKKQEREISSNRKEVTVYSPDNLNYQNVLSYTNISPLTKDKDSIKIFWKEENKYLDFNVTSMNENGFINGIEWIIPHLSNQTFDIIIITKAEHLDSNKNFISGIYDNVKSLDNNWSEPINENEYIRVTFEKNLSSDNDITIYPKIISGNPRIEVYPAESDNKIAEFSSIISDSYNKVYLTGLNRTEDTFDLKVINGSLSFDYIVDPPEDGMALVFNDTFTGANGNLFLHSPNLGISWTEIYDDGSNLQINSNQLDASGGNNDGSGGYANISSNWKSNQLVKVTYAVQDSGNDYSHLIVRADSDWSNAYAFSFSTTAANTVLWKRVGAVNADLNASCGADNQFTAGDIVTLKVVGNLIEVFDGNTLVCSAADSDISYGRAGAGIGASPHNTDADVDAQRLDNLLIYTLNTAPTSPFPSLNSSDGTNFTSSDLICSSNINDTDLDVLNVTVIWYKNDINNLTISYNNSYVSSTNFSAALKSGNLTSGDIWKCSIKTFDGMNYSNWINSSNIIVFSDSTPPTINITYPLSTIYYNMDVTSLNYSYSDANPGYCWYSNLSGEWNSSAVSAGANFTISSVLGINTLTLYCNDSYGNLNSSSITFTRANATYKSITIENVTTNSSNTATTISFIRPANTRNGDILFAYITKDDNPTITVPSGWTQVLTKFTASGDNLGSGTWYKIITNISNEPVSYTWTGDNEQYGGGILLLRGVNLTYALDAPALNTSGTNNPNFICPSITTVTNGALILACGGITFTGDTPSSSTPPADTTRQITVYVQEASSFCANFTQTPAGDTGTKQWTTNGNAGSEHHEYTIAFRPAINALPTGTPAINSSNGYNQTDSNLNCRVIINDSNYDLLNVSVRWYKNQELNLSLDYNNSYSPAYSFISTLDNNNLSVWDNWSCSIRIFDSQEFSNWTNSSVLMVRPDTTPPTINITYPLNITYAINISEINYTAWDYNNISKCWYTNSSGQWNSSLQVPGENFTSVITKEGQNNFTVYCNDSYNNLGRGNISFYIDFTNPNATLISPANNSFKNNATQNLTVNATDNVGLANATLFVFNSTNSLINQTNRNISGTRALLGIVYTFLYDGIFKWFYRIFDIAGYSFDTENFTITIENVIPLANITYPFPITYSSGISELNYTYSDANPGYCWYTNNSGIWNSSYQTPGQNWTGINSIEGGNTWTLYCNDTAGNLNISSVTFIINAQPPQINFTNPTPVSSSITRFTFVNINVSIQESSLNEIKYNWNGTNFTMYDSSLILMLNLNNNTILGEGRNNLTYDASLYENHGACKNMGVGCNWTTGKYGKGLGFDGDDDLINITSGDIIGTGDDSICAWIYPRSAGGNTDRIIDNGNTIFIFDTSNRRVRFVSDGSGGYINSATNAFTLNQWNHVCAVRDAIGNVEIYVQGNLSSSGNSGTPAAGTTNLYIGNRQALARAFTGIIDEVRIWNKTLTAYEVYQIYASNLQKTSLSQWYLYVNQSKNATNGLTEGLYTYFSSVKETSGIENMTEVRNITVETTAPNVNITYPVNNQNYTINVTEINYTYSDTNPGYCWYSNSSGTWNSSNIAAAGINFTNVITKDAWNNFTLYCNDSAGNLNFSRVNFTVHIRPPNGTLINPANNSFKNNATQNMTVNAADIVGLSNATLYIFNSSNDLINQTAAALTGTQAAMGIIYQFLYDGLFKWFYRIIDIADYSFNTGNYTITIDRVNSLVNLTYPENTAYYFNISTINYTYYDLNPGYCKYSNSSGAWNSTIKAAGQNFTNVITKDGWNNFTLYCNDSAGNINSSDITFYRNATAFTVSILYPSNNFYYNYNVSDINYTAISPKGVSRCWWSNNSGAYNSSDQSYLIGYFSNISYVQGLNNWTVYCNDTDSDVNSSTVNFTIDLVPPNGTLIRPENNSNVNVIQNFTVNAADNSNLSNATLYIFNSSDNLINQTSKNISGTQALAGIIVNLTDGAYKWYYNIYDKAENYFNTQNFTLNVNTEVPIVNITYPINNQAYTINVSEINYTYSDEDPGYCKYSNSSGAWNSSNIVSAGINFTNVITKEGSNAFTLYCNDSYGNINISRVNFTVHLLPPNGTLINPANNSFKNNATQNMTVNAADIVGLSNANLYIFNSSNDLINQTAAALTGTQAVIGIVYQFLYDDIFKWFYKIIDIAGYSFDTGNFTITIDRVNPLVNITYPLNNFNYTINVSNINYTYSDDNPGYCKYSNSSGAWNSTIKLAGQNFTNVITKQGWNNFTLYCNDSAGNTNSSNLTFFKDSIVPNITIIYPLNTSYNNDITKLNYTYSDTNPGYCWYSNSSGIWNSTEQIPGTNWTELVSIEGNNTWRVYCNDSYGNLNSANITFIKDTINPIISIAHPLNITYNINISTLNYTITDANPSYCWYSNSSGTWNSTIKSAGQNFTNVITKEGSNAFILYCNDTASNANSSGVSFFKDTIYPIVQFGDRTLPNSTNISQNFIYANVTINETNFVNITFYLYNNTNGVTLVNSTNYSYLVYTINWTSLPDAIYYYNITVFDIANNKNSTETRKITLDTNAPNATLLTPINNTITHITTQNLTVNATDNIMLSNATLFVFNSSGNLINQATAYISGTVAITGIVYQFIYDGIFKWFYQITDTSGNRFNTQNNTITIDTVLPGVNIIYPLNISYIINVSTLNYTFSDNLNISRCWYSNSSGIWNSTSQVPGTNFTNVISKQGSNTWTVYCNDTAGNINSSTVSFFKDSIVPNMIIIYPLNASYNLNISQLNYTYFDANPGYCWYSNSSGTWNSTFQAPGENFTGVISVEGSNTWNIYCNDSFGNQNSLNINFFKDTVYPLIQFGNRTADNGTIAYQNWIYANVTVNESNEANITFYLYNNTNGITLVNRTTYTNNIRTINWTNLNPAVYYYNITVIDAANNQNSTETRYFNYTMPDFSINSSDITVNSTSLKESDWFNITANIHNLGAIDIANVTVRYYNGDPDLGGVQIGLGQNISISKYSSNLSYFVWNSTIGLNNIFVFVDPPASTNGSFRELNESNNKASTNISVQSWSYFYGNMMNNSIYALADLTNNSLERWLIETINTGNIYVTTSNAVISWPDLQAISKNIADGNAANDFSDIDTLLQTSIYNDSIYSIYTESGQIKETENFTIFNKNIPNVPIANSTNNSNFITGILWDMEEDTDGEFSQADKESLIFVAKINKDKQGAYGIYDYELRVPAKLRNYNAAAAQPVIFYAEIQ